MLQCADRVFAELPDILRAGDLLVINNSKVLPHRFIFEHRNSEMEVLLLEEETEADHWLCLAKPMKRAKLGEDLALSEHILARVLGRDESGERLRLVLRTHNSTENLSGLILSEGQMPIPGYIRQGRADHTDAELYQTVYAKHAGSVAAPTAGLHFTAELFHTLKEKGVEVQELTLHVGPASFQPVRDFANHEMPTEWYSISADVMAALERAKKEKRRIVCVGTTSARTLESAARDLPKPDEFVPTKLFITPGFEFKYVDVLMTNFHQPGTTHLLLVAAFIGEENTSRIYEHALASDYRFLSYGDTMLLEREERK